VALAARRHRARASGAAQGEGGGGGGGGGGGEEEGESWGGEGEEEEGELGGRRGGEVWVLGAKGGCVLFEFYWPFSALKEGRVCTAAQVPQALQYHSTTTKYQF
jgi:hypothetical protein